MMTTRKLITRDAGGAFECRSFNRPLELRELKKDGYIGTLVGYAIIFESESRDMGGWREIITRGAPSESLKKADVRLLYQHDKSKVMARQSAGNLRLTEDEIGVRFEADLIDTTLNRDAYAEIRSGNVDAMSFGAPKATFKSKFETRSGGGKLRRVSSFEVQEISVVSWAAYEDTALAAREFAEFVASENQPVVLGVDPTLVRARMRHTEMELRFNHNHGKGGKFSAADEASSKANALSSEASMPGPDRLGVQQAAAAAHREASAAHEKIGNHEKADDHSAMARHHDYMTRVETTRKAEHASTLAARVPTKENHNAAANAHKQAENVNRKENPARADYHAIQASTHKGKAAVTK